MAYKIATPDSLGDNYGFRKVRAPLGVTAFGVNWLVYPPGREGVLHYHDTQDELYLVHRGTAKFTVDGEEHIVEAGGLVHVESETPRLVVERAARATSTCSSSAARAATSSATATSSTRRSRQAAAMSQEMQMT